jgi:hypothetical protein
MVQTIDPDVRTVVEELVRDLVAARYRDLENDGRAGRLTSGELARAISDYGRTMVALPVEAWEVVDVHARDGMELFLDVPLWTKEEGRSDLTLSLTIERRTDGPRVSIDDLRVP